MAIKMVREPSDTPNITNIDDIIPFRYAYGGQNGFVLNRGTEISNTISGLNFTINSGRLVLQGVECDIDASGVTVTIDNIATKRYYTVYLQVNLATNTATVLATYDTANYPNPPASDDLTENSTGTAYLVLYHFTATSGVISEVNKIVESIKYTSNILVNNSINSQNAVHADNADIATNAQNSILKPDGTYEGFSKNNNNELSTITGKIEQKKIIFSGNTKIPDSSVTLSESIHASETIEITFSTSNNEVIKQQFVLTRVTPSYTNMNFTLSYIDSASASQMVISSIKISCSDGGNVLSGSYELNKMISRTSISDYSNAGGFYILEVAKII